mmetsp:Transcript_30044/g.94210  ORF Transcript_30044/g.94210 Transcript_30044/m.94210 type:complete len:372 (+) Transcript_30044:71-1186(+)
MPSIGDRSEGNERGPRNGVIVTDVMALLEAAELPRDDPQVAAAHTVLLARLPLTRMVELAGHTREGAAPLRLEGRGGALALEQRDGLTSWVRPPTPEQQRQGQSGRVALLAGLREAGVAPLAMRQVIATALFKARREARLSPSDAERALPVSSGSARPLAAEVGAGCAPPSPLRFHPTSDLHARGGRDEATGGWRGGEQEELGLPLPAARRRVILQNGEVVGVQGALGEGGSGEGGPEAEAEAGGAEEEEEAHEPSAAEEAWEEGPPSASSSLCSPLSRGRTSPPPASKGNTHDDSMERSAYTGSSQPFWQAPNGRSCVRHPSVRAATRANHRSSPRRHYHPTLIIQQLLLAVDLKDKRHHHHQHRRPRDP